MGTDVQEHYRGGGKLAERIGAELARSGRAPADLTPADYEAFDEFHFRGREATLELGARMHIASQSKVLDIGSGLGGTARTLATEFGCSVIGIDLTEEFCTAASVISDWLGLGGLTRFQQGDATDLPFADNSFDAAITIHVGMNIAAKDRMYAEARRVLKPGGILAIYDILQGEGGEPYYPAPWAQDPGISHLAMTDEMKRLVTEAGFTLLDTIDSTDESLAWLDARTDAAKSGAPPVPITTKVLFGDVYRDMVKNQARGLRERRLRTASFLARA